MGWRAIFWMNAALCAAALWLALRYIRHEWREAEGERFDAAGAAIYASSILALTHGFSTLPAGRGFVSLAAAAAGLFVLGVGFGLFSSPNTNAIMGSVEPRQYGLASAMVGTMRMLGQMFSMGAATLVIAVAVGRNEIGAEHQEAFLRGARGLLAGFAVLSTLGIFASLARGNVHGR